MLRILRAAQVRRRLLRVRPHTGRSPTDLCDHGLLTVPTLTDTHISHITNTTVAPVLLGTGGRSTVRETLGQTPAANARRTSHTHSHRENRYTRSGPASAQCVLSFLTPTHPPNTRHQYRLHTSNILLRAPGFPYYRSCTRANRSATQCCATVQAVQGRGLTGPILLHPSSPNGG